MKPVSRGKSTLSSPLLSHGAPTNAWATFVFLRQPTEPDWRLRVGNTGSNMGIAVTPADRHRRKNHGCQSMFENENVPGVWPSLPSQCLLKSCQCILVFRLGQNPQLWPYQATCPLAPALLVVLPCSDCRPTLLERHLRQPRSQSKADLEGISGLGNSGVSCYVGPSNQ